MTVAQSFKIYEVLGKYFSSNEDAKIVVSEIEQIIESKIADKKDVLAAKEDISKLREDSLQLQLAIEKRFNQLTIWIGSTATALAGIIIAVSRMK